MIFINTLTFVVVTVGGITVALMARDYWVNNMTSKLYLVVPAILTIALGAVAASAIEMNVNHMVKDIEVKACLKVDK